MKPSLDNPFVQRLHEDLLLDARNDGNSIHINRRAVILGMTVSEYRSFISKCPDHSSELQKKFRDIIINAHVGYSQVEAIRKRK